LVLLLVAVPLAVLDEERRAVRSAVVKWQLSAAGWLISGGGEGGGSCLLSAFIWRRKSFFPCIMIMRASTTTTAAAFSRPLQWQRANTHKSELVISMKFTRSKFEVKSYDKNNGEK
jgi:hypothetical protein